MTSFGIYAIRKIFDTLTHGTGTFRGAEEVRFGEVTIRSHELKAILDYRYTTEERQWVLPTPYREDANQFLVGVRKP